jgi:hypothetical protein
MTDKRIHMRLDCEEHCKLHLKDLFYPAMVRNISLGGALVHFYDPLPGVNVGDNCKVSLNGDLYCEYDCEIARIDTSHVALRFIDMHIP